MTSAPAAEIPTLDINLYDDAILPDPWAVLRRIREAGPVVWDPKGYYMTARDRVCRRILNRAPEIGQEGMVSAFFGEEAFISTDDKPLHNALRNVWAPSFSREAVAELAKFVRVIADEMLDKAVAALAAGEAYDIMGGMCRPLPTYVIAHMMGVEDHMVDDVVRWSDAMGDATAGGFPIDYDNDPYWLAGEKAKADLADFLYGQFDYRRKNPGDDLISKLVQSEIGQSISPKAMMVNCRQLLFAGNETTAKWLGHIAHTLGQRPDVRAEIDADRSLIPGAAEEIMRWQGVTQVLPRGVKGEDVSLEGVPLPDGAQILLLLGGAGRDPDRWENPEELDIHRKPQPHLGFGFGLHSCLGAVLARMEALVVTNALLDKLPAYAIREPVKYGNFSLRGATELWIEAAR
jgi:cytochrome P450